MPPLVLLTGATGYVGGRLVPVLLDHGFRVRCLVRDPDRLRDHPWAGRVEAVRADTGRPETLGPAFDGVDIAYYLVHSPGSGSDFERTAERSARAFGHAARVAGAGRIIYLGGLAPASVRPADLPPHLRSRLRVGRVLRASGVPTVELRAAVVIGSGSASFEILRHLTERLPVMLVPAWVTTNVQPIAVRDVLGYLVGAATAPAGAVGEGRVFDIGGPDVLTYRAMMERYAAIAGLPRRRIVQLPVLNAPALSSQWVGAVTPVPASIARPLVESLGLEAVCRDHRVAELVPDPPAGLLGFDAAVRLALARIKEADVATRWSSASVAGAPGDPLPTGPDRAGGVRYQDARAFEIPESPDRVWQAVEAIGGETGWYSFPLAWIVRGWLDRAAGGTGLRRGRRDPARLRLGESLDWWRVEALERGRLLRLRAEMKMPGLGWFEMRVDPAADGGTLYRQRAVFYPHGVFGHVYWWAMVPFHEILYRGMARNLAGAAHAAGVADAAGAADVAGRRKG